MPTMPSVTKDIPLDKITLGASQARQRDTTVTPDDDLVLSIQKHGLISPVVVKYSKNGQYELLIGQRRFRAFEYLKRPTIKAYVMDHDVSESSAKALSLIENVARKKMEKADLMDTVQYFMEKYNNSIDTVAKEIGLSPPTVSKYFSFSLLPKAIREDVNKKLYSMNHALKAFKALDDSGSNTNVNMIQETALAMKELSPPGQKKFAEIKKKRPDSTTQETTKKSQQQTETHPMYFGATDDMSERIEKYKKREDIKEDSDAVSELVDIGLNTEDL